MKRPPRTPTLLLSAILVLVGLGPMLASCGSDDSGSNAQGGAGSGGGAAAGGDGTSGADAAAGTGGGSGDSSTCLDPAMLPKPPTVSVSVAASCGSQACGGAPSDALYELSSLCIGESTLVPAAKSACATAKVSLPGAVASGLVVISGAQFQLEMSMQASAQVTIPNECAGCACESAETMLQVAGATSAKCSPECQAGSCICMVDVEFEIHETGSVDSSGAKLVTSTGSGFGYCLDSDGLKLIDSSTAPRFGLASFEPGAASAELCDGLDNDLDGAIDDDPRDCPPCLGAGVCAGSATAKCNGAAGWSCTYSSPAYEAEETKCDGLDNDCDGQVDELEQCKEICDGIDNDGNGTIDDNLGDAPDCPGGTGVCTSGGQAKCAGALGWQCEYSSAAYQTIETTCDGLDNDCDGLVDEACSSCVSVARVWTATSHYDAITFATSYSVLWKAVGGTTATAIASGPGKVDRLRTDDVHGKIYWAEDDVLRANLDGSGKEQAVAGSAFALAVDPAGDWLYGSAHTSIWRAPTTAGAAKQSIGSGTYIEHLVATGSHLYWIDNPGLHRAAPDGTGVELLNSDIGALAFAADLIENRIYWIKSDSIQSADLNATGVETIVELPATNMQVRDMAIDPYAKRIYVAVNSGLATVKTDGTELSAIPSSSAYNFLDSVALSGCIAQ